MLYIYNNLEEYLDILTYCTISLKFYKYNKKKYIYKYEYI